MQQLMIDLRMSTAIFDIAQHRMPEAAQMASDLMWLSGHQMNPQKRHFSRRDKRLIPGPDITAALLFFAIHHCFIGFRIF